MPTTVRARLAQASAANPGLDSVQASADGTFALALLGLPPGPSLIAVTAQADGEAESAPALLTVQGPPAVVVAPPPPPPVVVPVVPGTWANVTPAGVSLDPHFVFSGGQDSNYGFQGVALDTANPGTAFVAVCYQGIWVTHDFGLTWTKLTDPGGPFDNGRPALAFAPDGSYLLSTLLYPTGNFANGCWKSAAPSKPGDPPLGKAWRYVAVPGVPNGDDVGHFWIDPAAPKHAFCQPHSPNGSFYESHDAGETWTAQPLPAGVERMDVIDGQTLIACFAWNSGQNPQLAKPSGSTWSWGATTTKDEKGNPVAGQTAFHGDQEPYVDPNDGSIYLGGPEGLHRSADGGRSWIKLAVPQSYSGGLVGTPRFLYSSTSYAAATGFQLDFMAVPRAQAGTGAGWKTLAAPAAMNNGWLQAQALFDGTNWIVLAGCWNAGLWRYVEPA